MSDRKPLPLLLIKGRKAERKGRKKNGREGGKKTQEKNFYLWRFQWVIGEGNGNPLQYSCLENSVDREQPGGLPSMGSHRVGHN